MDEIIRIMKAISAVTKLSGMQILSKTADSYDAQLMLCHTVKYETTGLIRKLADMMEIRQCDVLRMADIAEDEIKKLPDNRLLIPLNQVRKNLDIPAAYRNIELIVRNKKEDTDNANTQRLFGFKYSKEDETRMRHAMVSASWYMRKLCGKRQSCAAAYK